MEGVEHRTGEDEENESDTAGLAWDQEGEGEEEEGGGSFGSGKVAAPKVCIEVDGTNASEVSGWCSRFCVIVRDGQGLFPCLSNCKL